jgi:hypothetical protein
MPLSVEQQLELIIREIEKMLEVVDERERSFLAVALENVRHALIMLKFARDARSCSV